MCKGLRPFLLLASTDLGSILIRDFTASMFPVREAIRSGVHPSLFRKLRAAPRFIRASTHRAASDPDFVQASISGVQSARFRGSISAPVELVP